MEKKATQKSIKEHNIGLVLENIKENNSITRIELSHITGLAKSTISDLVTYLINKKIVYEGKTINSKIGKKPIILKFNNNLFYILAINIGIINITVAISNLNGEIFIKKRRRNSSKDNRNKMLESIFNIVEETIKESKISLDKIYLISIGTHGIVDPKTRIVTHAPYFEGWSGINLYRIFIEKFKKVVIVENGVNLGAIGERWKEYGKLKDIIYLYINYGIGAGLIINGILQTGIHGSTGEISYLPIMSKQNETIFKKNTLETGLFESQVDVVGIMNIIKDKTVKMKFNKDNNVNLDNLNFDDVCNYYKSKGNNFVKKIIDNTIIKTLAIGIACMITVIDTELIVVNGIVANLGDRFIKKLREEIYRIIPFKPQIVVSSLRNDAVILGAIKNGIDYMNDLLYKKFFSIKFLND